MNKYAHFAEIAKQNNRRLRACGRKKRYTTEEAAICKNQTVYKCKYCGGYHRSASLNTLINVCRKLNEHKQSKRQQI
jgi:hypothetical protein